MRTALLDLRSSTRRVIDITGGIDRNVRSALRSQRVRERNETTQCALTVILSGYFESFLKEVAEACVADVCSRNLPFGNLPERMRRAHFENGGEMLAKKIRNRVNWLTCTPDDIARRIGSVVNTVPYELVWEAFADTNANPGPQTIKEYMGRFGLTNAWALIAAKVAVRKPSWSETTLKTMLQCFMEVRHECAHSGRATQPPTPSELREYCELIYQIGEAIVEVLEDNLNTLQTPAAVTTGPTIAPGV